MRNNIVCTIKVAVFPAGCLDAQKKGEEYGPYADKSEAEKALKDSGWKKHPLGWEMGELNGKGVARLAHVSEIAFRPRNRLPRA